jgi:hypothetical protein
MIMEMEKGFIAITTTMILSVILLVVATSLSFSGFFTRYNILDSELKKVSVALAEGCVDQGLLELAVQPNSPITNKEIIIGNNPCIIENASISGSEIDIKSCAVYKKYITKLEVKARVESGKYPIESWIEITGSTCP